MHGAMLELVVDGERGICIAQEMTDYLKQKGIKLRERAPEQHARIIERRGAHTREAMHRIKSQCDEEGIQVPDSEILSEAVFAGNALLSINDSTPYNALYGRTPPLLPGLEILNGEGEITPPTNKTVGRIREIAVMSIVEGTARNKLTRALSTRTLPAAELQNLKVGDEVDFYDSQAGKVLQSLLVLICLLYTSPSPRDRQKSRMPSSA